MNPIKGKQIKTVFMEQSHTIVAGAPTHEAQVRHTWQDKITIIGISLVAEALAIADQDSGYFATDVDISVVGARKKDGSLLHVVASQFCRQATIGIGIGQVVTGNNIEQHDIFFPEGKGVDMDYLDVLYANISYFNDQAQNQSGAFLAIIYYVER